ncbi:Aste57867_12301 [Aphanomyces stellatus]|uniref:Aste57867_12301 protein n=1 Tax=Aphanomyces stellatus TaxID=120398 RepID=A0A485KVN3_9STRA|nr:hypothetical protein As57867_012255 [Aphanomyces stellatus]VFT89154.1 Aste57867_12301 [Aphanomyces stellatus]
MNLIQGKTNQYLRDAILENNVEKARKYLTLVIGKADVQATTENGGFSMLHCAVIIGNTQMVMMLLQLHASIWAITDDGYSALDLALWKGHAQIIEILRSQGAIAPMKEPESLNGKKVLHLGREATVVDYFPSTAFRTKSTRALHYATGENYLVNLWAGTDYKIVGPSFTRSFRPDSTLYNLGLDPMAEHYKALPFLPSEVGMDAETHSVTDDDEAYRGGGGSQPEGMPPVAIPLPSTPATATTTTTSIHIPPVPDHIEAKFEAALEKEMEDRGGAFFDDDDDDDSDSDDEDDDVVVEKTVEVTVPPGPLGVLLDSGIAECAVVQGFTPLPTGEAGAIQASGVVLPGMYIIGINETNASLMSLQQVIQLLGKLARKDKIIRFAVFRPKDPTLPVKVKKEVSVASSPAPTQGQAAPTMNSLSDLVSAVRDRRASSAAKEAPAPQVQAVATPPPPAPVVSSAPPETECSHCGLPSTVHLSKDCPYK